MDKTFYIKNIWFLGLYSNSLKDDEITYLPCSKHEQQQPVVTRGHRLYRQGYNFTIYLYKK